jgi:hypothetical protein
MLSTETTGEVCPDDGRRSQISRDLDRAARSWRWSEPLCLAESGKLAQIIARTRRHPADIGS